MSSYQLSASARRDLNQIRDYIALEDAEVADRTILELTETMERLAEFPRMGKPRSDLSFTPLAFARGNHLIFYRAVTEGVIILRVIHSSRDTRRIFP